MTRPTIVETTATKTPTSIEVRMPQIDAAELVAAERVRAEVVLRDGRRRLEDVVEVDLLVASTAR